MRGCTKTFDSVLSNFFQTLSEQKKIGTQKQTYQLYYWRKKTFSEMFDAHKTFNHKNVLSAGNHAQQIKKECFVLKCLLVADCSLADLVQVWILGQTAVCHSPVLIVMLDIWVALRYIYVWHFYVWLTMQQSFLGICRQCWYFKKKNLNGAITFLHITTGTQVFLLHFLVLTIVNHFHSFSF